MKTLPLEEADEARGSPKHSDSTDFANRRAFNFHKHSEKKMWIKICEKIRGKMLRKETCEIVRKDVKKCEEIGVKHGWRNVNLANTREHLTIFGSFCVDMCWLCDMFHNQNQHSDVGPELSGSCEGNCLSVASSTSEYPSPIVTLSPPLCATRGARADHWTPSVWNTNKQTNPKNDLRWPDMSSGNMCRDSRELMSEREMWELEDWGHSSSKLAWSVPNLQRRTM